jgi:hypothetical protein
VKPLATALALSSYLLVACGGDDTSGSAPPPPDPNDKRGLALYCLEYEKEIQAKEVGENAIQVGDDPESDPRIEFFVTSGEAEGRQFQGNAQGAEHIGNALLFVREGSDELLEEIEACLQDL